eukprot:CAMPEP_0202700920 /NCGR_PEP_ID=MMETSP1385-20130828/14046_1 /ASSEMBLY_ACC=CAM_ASM_000861 /TAXON_ID=933848 /ORGANISM="Elphidium margaritaceum" /LENGTH=160 /DNA_ID=CAMNT_0049358211 /DNA_START=177 /DNA_END=659 /DNA_ORIENTATION=-
MSYIGNKQWIGENSAGEWDYENPQEMPASYFLTIHQFENTNERLGKHDIDALQHKYKGYFRDFEDEEEDGEGENEPGFLISVGDAVKVFLVLFVGITAAIVSLVVAVVLGYIACDYNLKRVTQIVKENTTSCEKIDGASYGDNDDADLSEKIHLAHNPDP